ncbi:MAG: hypothetical protein JW888_04130, partial [Pirellulales bacterium]|nr:hypothetical protein [Pirellulales bacterium]
LVGYLGTTGQLGFLSLLDRWSEAPNPPGSTGQQGRMWRHRDERFTVFSFQREVLAEVCPQLRFVPAERPAQIRLHVGDVSQARLTPALATMSYLRTRTTSAGNLRLLHAMNQQLHVPGPDCRVAAELILDARLVCPLGGRYEYRQRPDGSGYWTSTALENSPGGGFLDAQVPPGYMAPPLSWFRGLEAEVTMTDKHLSAHVEVVMQLPEKPLVAEPDEESAAPASEKQADEQPAKTPGGWFDAIVPPKKK